MSTIAPICHILVPTYKNKEEKVKPFNVNKKNLPSLPGNGAKNLIEPNDCTHLLLYSLLHIHIYHVINLLNFLP